MCGWCMVLQRMGPRRCVVCQRLRWWDVLPGSPTPPSLWHTSNAAACPSPPFASFAPTIWPLGRHVPSGAVQQRACRSS
eukprot:224424-Chlamydomonas_euryale.AAC.1